MAICIATINPRQLFLSISQCKICCYKQFSQVEHCTDINCFNYNCYNCPEVDSGVELVDVVYAVENKKKTKYTRSYFVGLENNKDDNIHKKRGSKKSDLYLNQGPRKSRFPLNLTDRQTYERMDRHQYLQNSFATKKVELCYYF